MTAPYFNQKQPIKFKKGKSKGLAFRHYDADRKVLGKRMEDQLRFAACYWHSFCWPGTDPFGGETFLRFNFGTQRARVIEAVSRMQEAFADLQ